jgi:hypothetical protein
MSNRKKLIQSMPYRDRLVLAFYAEKIISASKSRVTKSSLMPEKAHPERQ